MINELHGLAVTLEDKGISSQSWHREYKPLPKVTPKAPCVRIWIAEDGSVCDFESLDATLAQSLRKYGNNQGSFPAFNIVPLYRVVDREPLAELERIEKSGGMLDLEKVKAWCVNDNWKKSIINKVDLCLHSIPQRILPSIEDPSRARGNVISELIRLTAGFASGSQNGFRASLEKCIFRKLQANEEVSLALSLLFHKGDAQKKAEEDVGSSLSIILDVRNWQQYGYPVASGHTTAWLNEKLLAAEAENARLLEGSAQGDAFGDPFVNPDEPMPNVRLQGFDVTLRSMFNGQPCQYRYGQIDDGSYPIGKENRSRVHRSLEWIADSSREGITWRKVDKNELVFVYPSKLAEIPPKFASVFGAPSAADSSKTEARFESVAKEFIKTLRGLPANEKPDFMQIFTIRKLDRGRSKVLFTRVCSPEQLVQAAEAWQAGCHNLPPLDLGEQVTPFPLQIARVINNVWKQSGEPAQGKASVERMKYYQGIELLLDLFSESMLRNFLHILLVNSSGLVNHMGNWLHGSANRREKMEEARFAAVAQEGTLVFSVLGLFLYKWKERKEKYMENMAYLIGQLLHISDELHAFYCKVVRNGEIPPQLAGSALFAAAGEMPYLALSQLSLRMNPYISWAKQYRHQNKEEEGKESRLAGWYLHLFENTANQIMPVMQDTIRFGDMEKAQLFIGYLASFPKRDPAHSPKSTDNQQDQGGSDHGV